MFEGRSSESNRDLLDVQMDVCEFRAFQNDSNMKADFVKFGGIFILFFCLLLFVTSAHSQTISIIDIPAKLPAGLASTNYSPPIGISYSGLKTGYIYNLAGTLLIPGSWNYGSTFWHSNSFILDNTQGTNSSGILWVALNMDVFTNFSGQFDWQFGLYTAGNQVTLTNDYIPTTTNRPPVLALTGNRFYGVGQTIGILLSATDPDGDAVQYGATNLPAGATLDTSTGQFIWTPTNAGNYGPVVFWAQDNGDGDLQDGELVTFAIAATPFISNQPLNQVVTQYSTVNFSVTAQSSTSLSYQWQFNGTNLSSQTASTLMLNTVSTNNAGDYLVVVSNAVGVCASQPAVLTVGLPSTPVVSVDLNLAELQNLMDEYHLSFQVYTDISAGGNHFFAFGKLPDQNSAVGIFGSCTNRPHSGATCVQCTFTNLTGSNNGGFYFMSGILYNGAPLPYFGGSNLVNTPLVISNFTGYNLTGSTSLTFWARGEKGGEQIEFFVGGVGYDPSTGIATNLFPDSMSRWPVLGQTTVLTTNWQEFTINLTGKNLTNIMGGFGWFTSTTENPNGATFYLDDIQYQLSPTQQTQRLNLPRFIRSYRTLPVEPDFFNSTPDVDFDLVLRAVAYTYDNAVAILAFLADGSSDSLRRAELLGDAFVQAANQDRTYTDGRFRTAYMPGDLAVAPGWVVNGKVGTVPMPGFYLENPDQYYELQDNANVDTGNNAWGMIALLALYRQSADTNYLIAAENAGQFIQTMRSDAPPYPGYLGGINEAETTSPTNRTYKSTEHNLDIYAAFSVLYQITGQTQWLSGSLLASNFVESMWETNRGCYLAGTTGSVPDSRNQATGQLPLDTQTWTILAIPGTLNRHPNLFAALEQYHHNQHDGFDGEDFNDDLDGVWFEGTSQAAVAYASVGNSQRLDQLRSTLQTAQQIPPPYGDGMGTPAASHDGISSGFGFDLFRRPHVGATSWNIFAQKGFNPFYQTRQPLSVQNISIDTGKNVHLQTLGEPGDTVVLQKSTNMVQWAALATNNSAFGENAFTNQPVSTDKAGFYRAMIQSGTP
jgi:hypothetical protein